MADQSIIARVVAGVRYAATGTMPAGWFGPNTPLPPQAPPEVAGRQFDYPVAINLNYKGRPGELQGFDKLKALAAYDNVRIVIEGQKDKLEALGWSIKYKPVNGKSKPTDQGVTEIQTQLEYPDRILDWGQWLRGLLDQNFVLDAVSIYRRRDRGGRPYSFELLDGATIKPLIDEGGRRPMLPDASYQQILKGLPAVNYTTEELLYFPQNVRIDHVFGYSRLEQIVDTVETAIQRLRSQKAFFTHGNLSDGFFEAPEGVTPDQVKQVETMWNSLLSGTPIENRRMNQFLPAGFKWNAIGAPPLQNEFDEWLIRIVCFCFSTAPTPFLKQQGLGQGSAATEHEAAEEAGLGNVMGYVKRVMDRILAEDFKRPDLEFAWDEDREFDPDQADQIQSRRWRDGRWNLNEAREAMSAEPIPGGENIYFSGAGMVLIEDILNPPEPPPAPGPVPPGQEEKEPDSGEAGDEPAPKDEQLEKAASRPAERRLGAALNRYLAAKGKTIIPELAAALGMEKAEDGYRRQIDDALNAIDWDWSDLPKLIQPFLASIAAATGKRSLDDLGLFSDSTREKLVKNAADYAERRAAEMVGRKLVGGELVDNEGWSIPSATREMIRKAVTSAMEDGSSNQDLAKAVRESGAFSKARATNIARTETATADVQGQYAGWRASGVVAGKEWLASDGCCEDCAVLDGEIVALDDDFTGGADCPLHPNCECAVGPVLPEDMPGSGDPTDD